MTLQERLRAPSRAGVIICREAADRIDALERERDEYKMAAEAEANFADQYKAKCAALERENAALRDALREVLAYCEEAGHDWMCMHQARNALRAIDAAMAQR